MLEFARRPLANLTDLFEESAARRGLIRVIVEKDFWVCYMLHVLFSAPGLKGNLIFKGGTSLSKVFGIIKRFSEDIDLSLNPAWLGMNAESDPDKARSRSQREKRWKILESQCESAVEHRIVPLLEERLRAELGQPRHGATHVVYRTDPVTKSPVIEFLYPTTAPRGSYIEATTKLEFGALTDQEPVVSHLVTPWVAEDFPGLFGMPSTRVIALDAERTFWEKATILHTEYHRPPDKPMRIRHSRDLYDLAALWNHDTGRRAVRNRALLERVVRFKERYFNSSWSNLQTAKPGTFRIVPPKHRLPELRGDYLQMRPMFLEDPPSFEELMAALTRIEEELNREGG